eukprot:SAG31_NODE_1333_length_8743_cov_1.681050_14_plen_104_part_00
MFVNVFPVPENGGALAVVPGSHKLPFNPWEVFGKSFKSSLTLDAELHPTDMPNYVQLAAPGELLFSLFMNLVFSITCDGLLTIICGATCMVAWLTMLLQPVPR